MSVFQSLTRGRGVQTNDSPVSDNFILFVLHEWISTGHLLQEFFKQALIHSFTHRQPCSERECLRHCALASRQFAVSEVTRAHAPQATMPGLAYGNGFAADPELVARYNLSDPSGFLAALTGAHR